MTLPSHLLALVDAYAASEGLTQEEALAFIVLDWLIGHGLLEPLPEDGDDELN